MTKETCLANAQLILYDRILRGAITIAAGKIIDIEEGDHVPSGAQDMEGDFVAPGLVELHTDNLERHIEPRPKVNWPHLPAIMAHDTELAGCGITTVFDAMRTGAIPQGHGRYQAYARDLSRELLSARTAGLLKIRHRLHLRAEICSETLAVELAEFTPDDRIGLMSLMDHTPGQRQFRDLTKLGAYIKGKRGLSDEQFDEHVAHLTQLRKTHGDAHEREVVAAAARLGATLASHDDTSLAQVEHSATLGVKLAEFPTTLEAARACRDVGIEIIIGAPNVIRGGSHFGNVSALDLARQDCLDILSSDYIPSGLILAAFRLGEYWQNLPRAMATVTANPARTVGFTDRGQLEQGLLADVIRISVSQQVPRIESVWVSGHRVA